MQKKKTGLLVIYVCVAVFCLVVLAAGIGIGNIFGGIWETRGDAGDSGISSSYSYAAGDIKSLRIDWVNGKVSIRVLDDIEEIRIEEHANRKLKESEQLFLEESSDGSVDIRWRETSAVGNSKGFGVFSRNKILKKELIIEIPRSMESDFENAEIDSVAGGVEINGVSLDSCFINTTSGSIKVDDASINTMDMDSVSGSIKLADVYSENASLYTTSGSISAEDFISSDITAESVSGHVDLSGEFEMNIDAGSTSGGVKIDSAVCPNHAELDTVSGGIKLNIPENDGFTVEYESMSGKFSSEFTGADKEKSGKAVYGNGDSRFEMSTISGNMSVNILQAG